MSPAFLKLILNVFFFVIYCRTSGQNLYEILGLEKTCTETDIKKAYRKVLQSSSAPPVQCHVSSYCLTIKAVAYTAVILACPATAIIAVFVLSFFFVL